MDKAHKVYEKLRDADGYTIGDIYVAINAQYHDYCELFEKWFGSNFDERLLPVLLTFGSKMMISMATRYGSTSTRCNPYYN